MTATGAKRSDFGPARVRRNPRARLSFATRPTRAARVAGLQRSGNHAIISWLLRNSPHQNRVFLNNCWPGQPPEDSYAQIEVNGERWNNKKLQGGGQDDLQRITSDDWFLLVSYERQVPRQFEFGADNITPFFADSDFGWQATIYRSFLNWLASSLLLRRRQALNKSGEPQQAFRRARNGISDYMAVLDRIETVTVPSLTPIRYDDWVKSPAYREGVLAALGMEVKDNSLGEVQDFGGGSSFEGKSQSAPSREVTHRWKTMLDDEEYIELVKIAKQMDGFMPLLSRHFADDHDVLTQL